MTDPETPANPADEAPPVVETSPAEAVTENDDIDELEALVKEGLGDPDQKPEPKIVEVEIDGKVVKVSEDAKDYLLRQADYTKKTTEVARERESVEAEKARVAEVRMVQDAVINATAELRSLENQINELSKTPIDGLPDEQVNALQRRLVALQAKHLEVKQDVAQIEQIERQKLSEDFEKQRKDAIAEAERTIPNFNDKRREELEALAVELGVDKDDARSISDRAAYEILHLADIGRKFLQRQSAAKKVETAQAASPAPQVGGKSTAAQDPNRMSTEAWMKWRAKQLAAS